MFNKQKAYHIRYSNFQNAIVCLIWMYKRNRIHSSSHHLCFTKNKMSVNCYKHIYAYTTSNINNRRIHYSKNIETLVYFTNKYPLKTYWIFHVLYMFVYQHQSIVTITYTYWIYKREWNIKITLMGFHNCQS